LLRLDPQLFASGQYDDLLQATQSSAAGFHAISVRELKDSLLLGESVAYWLEPGLMLVERHSISNQHRLRIVGIFVPRFGFRIRKITEGLRALATEWACDTVETTCFDLRLAKAILKVGGKVESVTVTLAVEN
jgi:hypothetical protein